MKVSTSMQKRSAAPAGLRRRGAVLVVAAGAVLAAGCAQPGPPPAGTDGGWPLATFDAANTRHSPLVQLTPANVAALVPAWQFETGASRGQEGGPLIVGDLLLLHTPFPNRVIALGLDDHAVRWTYTPQQDPAVASRMCCDIVSRGLASGRVRGRPAVFLQQADTTLVALDAATGAALWQVRSGDPARGETASNAPQVAGRYVLTGNAGGEYGVRGALSAYVADTGALAWRGASTGPDADMLVDPATTMTWRDGRMQPVGADASLRSWPGDGWQLGGGSTWGWFAYDPALRLVYYGSGNPGTWNALQRPGDNRWAASVWARDVDTGRVRWVNQLTPHDEWDYDAVNEMLLFDATLPEASNPTPRKLLAHFDRNGFAYVFDRASGALVSADAFDPSVNWARRIDHANGRPVTDPAFSPAAHGEDTTTTGICPAAIGAKNQAPASHDPALGLFFVPTTHLCMDLEPFHADHTAGQPYIGASYRLRPVPGEEAVLGRFVAWDAVHRRAAWSRDEPAPVWSGALSTASGLVFYGTLDGRLRALDARTGALLWTSPPLPSGVVGNVTTWAWRGRQFVGVLTGIGGLANDPDGIGGLRRGAAGTGPSRGALAVFALPAP